MVSIILNALGQQLAVCVGPYSRKTGFTEYLRQYFANRENIAHIGDVDCQHWFDQRRDVFSKAVESWNNEDAAVKKTFSDQAKNKNFHSNDERDRRIEAKKEYDKCKLADKKNVEELQMKMFETAFNSGLIQSSRAGCQGNSSQGALMDGGSTDADCADHLQVVERCLADGLLTTGEITQLLDDCPGSLCGLGDDEFAISDKLLDFAAKKTGFVEDGHKQLDREYGCICESVGDLSIDEKHSLDNGFKSCEQLLGRFCRCDIRNFSKYNGFIAMIQNIVRILLSRRSVKSGETVFMGMDVHWPVLLLRRDSCPTELFAWLTYRVCFNPYELDFVQCDVERKWGQCPGSEQDESFRLHLRFERPSGSNNMLPVSDSMRELAVWYSQQDGEDWSCSVYFSYDIANTRPCSIVLMPHHEHSSSAINCLSFEGLVSQKKQPKDSSDPDDPSLPSGLANMLKRIGGKPKENTNDNKKKSSAKPVEQLPIPDEQKRALVRVSSNYTYFYFQHVTRCDTFQAMRT